MFGDVALLVVYGAIVAAFLVRFARERRVAALFIAALPIGWLLLALLDLGARVPVPGLLRWGGVLVGLALLVFVLRSAAAELEG